MTDLLSASLMEYLMDAGYEPQDDDLGGLGYRRDDFDLIVSGTGSVRLSVFPDDGYRVEINAFDRYEVNRWGARFAGSSPDLAIVAVLGAAEDELADLRGGPVVPRQTGGTTRVVADGYYAAVGVMSMWDWTVPPVGYPAPTTDDMYRAAQVDHAACDPAAHDRSLPDDPRDLEAQMVAADGLLGCNDCRQPAYYCTNDHQYHHVSPDTPSCFLLD